jgi:hypothetical protein
MLKSTTLQGLSGMNPEIFLPIWGKGESVAVIAETKERF